jgi:SH3-like domain-containing protein
MSLCIQASIQLMQDKLILQRSNKFMQYMFAAVILCAFLSLPIAANAADEDDKKLPIPRFVSLKSNDVNIRVGPGTRYSISWVFKRANYPVEIIQEFDQWREIRDHEGAIGWVHKNMLQGKRSMLVTGDVRTLRNSPEDSGGGILRAEPGVIGQLIECEKSWCKLQIDSRKGWLPKNQFWGAYAKEEFKD